jgi:hypothetical protein
MNIRGPIPLPVTGTLTATPISVTPNTVAVGASQSSTIPSGAKGFTFVALSGTVTLGGAAIPAGTTISSNDILASSLAYTTAAASSAFVYFQT